MENLQQQFRNMLIYIGWRPAVGAVIGGMNDAAEFLVFVMTSLIAELIQVLTGTLLLITVHFKRLS